MLPSSGVDVSAAAIMPGEQPSALMSVLLSREISGISCVPSERTDQSGALLAGGGMAPPPPPAAVIA